MYMVCFFFNDTATTEIYTLSLHDALPICVGIAQRALELGLKYSQERKTFGKPIAQHQAIQFKLADMATKVEAARLLTLKAARMKDAGERSDLEAGMAKLFASEAGKEDRKSVV